MTALLKFSGINYVLDLKNNVQEQISQIFETLNLSVNQLSFTCRGRPLNVQFVDNAFQTICKDDCVYALIPLRGGKGGFGAKLKNQGGKKIKPNDNMFSRDMHGRRISYQADQKQYTEFCKKKKQQDEMVNQERQKFKVMETTLKQGQSFMKLDRAYHQNMQQTQRKLMESIQIGKQRQLQKLKMQYQKNCSQQKKEVQVQVCYKQQKGQIQEANQESKKQNDQIQKLGEPVKKTKVQSQVPFAHKLTTEKGPGISAKDKLKSLFKK